MESMLLHMYKNHNSKGRADEMQWSQDNKGGSNRVCGCLLEDSVVRYVLEETLEGPNRALTEFSLSCHEKQLTCVSSFWTFLQNRKGSKYIFVRAPNRHKTLQSYTKRIELDKKYLLNPSCPP
jgi:hypothetical protein